MRLSLQCIALPSLVESIPDSNPLSQADLAFDLPAQMLFHLATFGIYESAREQQSQMRLTCSSSVCTIKTGFAVTVV